MNAQENLVVANKKSWQSKTNWVALVLAICSFFPAVGQWVQSNPDSFMQIIAAVIFGLRTVTKGKIDLV